MSEMNAVEVPERGRAQQEQPKLARRDDEPMSLMLSRVLPDSGVSRLDVAAFNSSI